MDANLLLAVATLALVVGPFLARFSRRFAAAAALVDGVTVGGIVVVSLLHLLPEAAAHIGWWAPLLLIVGLVLPLLTERLLVSSWQGWRVTVGFLVLVLFVTHLLFEGAALASTAHDERLALATVIVVAGHNLPLGLLLWGQTEKRFGRAASIGVLLATAAVTWFGPVVIDTGEGLLAAVCSALLAGGLLHLVLQHEPHLHEPPALRNRWTAIGAVLAGAVLVMYLGGEGGHGGHQHREDAGALGTRFMELFLETAPPLLLGVIGASLIEAFLPGSFKHWLGRGPRVLQALRGVALGAPMPVCSCGVLPIYRSLVKAGVPTTAALSLLIAAPEIGIDSVLLSLPLLGGPTTVARLASALVLALLVGLAVGGAAERAGLAVDSAPDEHEEAPPRRSLVALRRGLLETWGHLAPWILVGLYATAFVEPLISTSWARDLDPWMQIAALTVLGLPTYICATAATPLAALLLTTGFAPGAVIAFLLTGPATNLTTIGALRRLHAPRVAWLFVCVAVGGTFLIGLGVDRILPAERILAPDPDGAHEHGVLQLASAWILVLLTLWVLLREGPRSFLGQLRPDGGGHHHHDDHAGGACEA